MSRSREPTSTRLPATIAACPAKSPAREAGLQVGDTIVEVDGVVIERQAQLRHALGPHVAGDTIRVVVERGEDKQRIEATIELVAELEPYVRPELGILPMRRRSGTAGDASGRGRSATSSPAVPSRRRGLQPVTASPASMIWQSPIPPRCVKP